MRTGELADIVRAEIKRRGGVIDRERQNRHIVIYWSIGQHKFMTTVARCRSAAPRLVKNAMAEVRRQARDMGAA
jgi:hypothetical protein